MAKARTGTCKIYASCKILLYPDSSMPAAPTMPCGAGFSILRFRSIHEYYKMAKYERLTPSELRDRVLYLKSRSAEAGGREWLRPERMASRSFIFGKFLCALSVILVQKNCGVRTHTVRGHSFWPLHPIPARLKICLWRDHYQWKKPRGTVWSINPRKSNQVRRLKCILCDRES